jgi:uncharacterized protein YcgL (UPF0745 family)
VKPLKSEDCEHAFRSARDLGTYHQNQLKSDLIEVLELLRKRYGTPEKRLMKNKGSLRLRWIYSIRRSD